MVDITLVGSQVSFVTAYVYFITKNLQQIMQQALSVTINKWYFGLGCFVIYVPLVMVRRMDKLAMTHVFGDIMIFTVIASLFVYGALAIKENGGFSTENVKPINMSLFPDAIGFSVYAYEGIGVILPLQDITADKDDYVRVMTYVLCFIFVLYIVFSEFSIFAFGQHSIGNNPLITQSMPQDSPLVWCIEICFCLNLVFSYPLMMHPANTVIESYLYAGWSKSHTLT
jgi:proton-coupled amino acid transporter